MKKKILFVCYGAGHVNMLVPIIKRYIKDPNFEVVVLGLTTASAVLKANGISHIGFRDLLDENLDKHALEVGQEMAADIPPGGVVDHSETVAYLGLSYADLEERLGKDRAEAEFESKGRQAFLPTTVLARVFKKYQPDLLVSTNSPRAERAAFNVAKDFGVRSVCIVGLFAMHEVAWIGEPDFCSKVCVISDSVKQFMVDAGRLAEDVEVTGNPALDRLARPTLAEEGERFREKNGWKDKKVVLWASQPEPEVHPFTGVKADPTLPKKVQRELLDFCEKREDLLLVVRYHPGESISEKDYPKGAYISTRDEDLAVLLKSVDVVVTMTSTVGLEAVLLGKPLVTIDTSVFRDDAPYSSMGISKGVESLELLGDSIDKVLDGTWQPSEELPPVGFAAERISTIINDLAK